MKDSQKSAREFSLFVLSEPAPPPGDAREKILSRVRYDLCPSAGRVFVKAGFIQVVVGFLTLLICPQFGYSPTGALGLMGLLMRYGEGVCMFGCGTLFAATSLLACALLLSREEARQLRANKALQLSLLSLLTVGTFLCLGAAVWELLTLAWIAGYLLGGWASVEVGYRVRRHFQGGIGHA